MASTRAAVLCLVLSIASTDAATLSATKLKLSDYRATEKEAPLPPMIEKADALTAEAPHLQASQQIDKSDSWEDTELDQPGLPPAKQRNPGDSPVVHAKVKQIMNLIQSHSAEYNDPKTTQQRKDSLLMETLTISRKHMGAPAFNSKYCLHLSNQKEGLAEASQAAFYTCPAFSFLDLYDVDPACELYGKCKKDDGKKKKGKKSEKGQTKPEVVKKEKVKIADVQAMEPSALKSAYLSRVFWKDMLVNDLDGVDAMLDEQVEMYEENQLVAKGKSQVSQKAPYIGWPRSSNLSPPEDWKCDRKGCIVPLSAYNEKVCSVMVKFSDKGYVNFIAANLRCWR